MSPHVTPVFERACAHLREMSGGVPAFAAFAPGRVNLIGEHTDYSGGFVLPVAIDRVCVAVARPRASDKAALSRVASGDSPGVIEFDAGSRLEPINSERGTPAAYIKGVLRQFQDFGAVFGPLDIAIASSVPLGAGLSSSASLEVAVATLAQEVGSIAVTPTQKASMCRRAEHEFAGVPCGIMDQYISAMGRADHALLIDCRTEEARLVAMPGPDQAALVVINTNVRHSLASGEYALRRAWCESAARKLGLESLREASERGERGGLSFVERERTKLGGDEYRAARHVVGENQRTLEGAAALERGDLELFGRLMNESHESLRSDFRVSCPELDFVVEQARKVPGVYGARMTGGGFGGCAIVLASPASVQGVVQGTSARFKDQFGHPCDSFVTRASDGAARIVPK
ncbi:MAG: galactokinase [Planctomycetota bacterium]